MQDISMEKKKKNSGCEKKILNKLIIHTILEAEI